MSQPSVGLLIIEINEPCKSDEPAQFYFQEIAESNNATASKPTLLLSKTKTGNNLYSHEIVCGNHNADGKDVRIRMGLLRFEEPYCSDIVVHMRSEGEDS